MSDPQTIVTGAPGWIGSRLVGALQTRVRCLAGPDAEAGAIGRLNADVVRGDLTDPSSLEPLFRDAAGATIYHLAGIIHPTRGVRQFYDVNVGGTEHLLRLSEQARVRRFVYLSSNSVVGVSRNPSEVFDETTPLHPYMNYGRSKKAAEDLVRAAASRGAIETAIVRAPWFYGPNQPPRQSEFFTMIRTGRVPLVGDGTNTRSMAYIDNLAQGLLLAGTHAAARNGTFWIADRRPYTMNEIIATIADVMAQDFGITVKRGVIRMPGFTSNVAQLADGTLQALGMYHQKIHVLSEMGRTIACSVAKAERELGYQPTIELREGMRRSIAWMREHGIAF